MRIRIERLRLLVIVLCLIAVGVAAFDTAAGAYAIAGLLGILLLVGITRWLTEGAAEADDG